MYLQRWRIKTESSELILSDLHHALDMFRNALIFTDHLSWHGADNIVGFIVVCT